MALELLVLTLDDLLFRHDASRRESAPRERGGKASAAADGELRIREQALTLMDRAEANGVRLALASALSSRVVCVLMDGALGQDWADRFAVVATGEALSVQDQEADRYALILRTAAVPPHDALLVTGSERGQQAARAIGMPAIRLPSRTLRLDGIDAPWLVPDDAPQARHVRASQTPAGTPHTAAPAG